jgi:hypothetical protein
VTCSNVCRLGVFSPVQVGLRQLEISFYVERVQADGLAEQVDRLVELAGLALQPAQGQRQLGLVRIEAQALESRAFRRFDVPAFCLNLGQQRRRPASVILVSFFRQTEASGRLVDQPRPLVINSIEATAQAFLGQSQAFRVLLAEDLLNAMIAWDCAVA